MPMRIVLKCHHIETTRSFYEEILDFEVIESNKETCTVQKEDCTIIFTAEDLWPGEPTCTGTLYMFINDVDGYYQSIKDKAIVLWPLQDMPYGTREFGIKDYDNYHLAFAQKNITRH